MHTGTAHDPFEHVLRFLGARASWRVNIFSCCTSVHAMSLSKPCPQCCSVVNVMKLACP